MSLKITRRPQGDVVVLDCCGRATKGEGTDSLRDNVRDVVDKGFPGIILNLADVSYMDSTGLGQLVSAFTYASNRGKCLKLLKPTEEIVKDLQMTKLYTIFDVFDNEAEAVRSFQ